MKSVLSRLSPSQYSIDPGNSSQLFSISLPSSSYRGSTVNVINSPVARSSKRVGRETGLEMIIIKLYKTVENNDFLLIQ